MCYVLMENYDKMHENLGHILEKLLQMNQYQLISLPYRRPFVKWLSGHQYSTIEFPSAWHSNG